ncbi:hypothetical protein GCM10010149_88980 [Nonomuraea roseoviolacea subsp. roseoviolacea]|uniref:DNA polymerase n=1 Tax=Nonomuraea roseoviolacea TaxID=103837 RepID=UPI0031D4699A
MPSSNTVLEPEHLDHVVKHFSRYGEFTYDIESVPPHRGVPAHNTVTWLSMATHGMAVSIPMGHEKGDKIIGERIEPRLTKDGKTRNYKIPIWSPAPEQLRPSQVFEAIEPLMFSDRLKICHNAPFDLGSVAKYYDGRYPTKPWFDTFLNSVLLDENRLNGLKPRVKQTYKLSYDSENVGKKVETHEFSKVARYAYLDSKYTWLLWKREKDLCREEGLSGVLELEHDVIETVLEMILNGAPINGTVLEELGVELDERLVETEAKIYQRVGRKFNLNAPQQKAQVLYLPKDEGGLGLRPKSLTDGGKKKWARGEELAVTDFSTDADALKPHKSNPVVSLMLDYQRDMKLKSTYVTGILGDPEDDDKPCLIVDGRVHGSFKQVGARTGRWSSAGPNLQNIPSRGEEGKKIRAAYEAAPGYKLIVADYGQIELVVLAHFIGHGALYDGFHAGIDAHTMTASLVFDVPFDQVLKEMRSVAKGLNFAIVYGAGPATVAEMAGITITEAKKHMAKHRQMFPEIYEYKAYVIAQARKTPDCHTRTILGRKRRLRDLRSVDDEKRSAAERQIFNAKIQGSATGDLIKLAMVRLIPLLPPEAELIMTVHDELVCHAPEPLVPLVEAALREAMLGEGIQQLVSVPLTSDQSVVDRWSAAK